ncbi:aminopeptidase N [Zhengella mangrovi]|uniref:Aminopeptidase N n=1 Tax=Zhengella mangrovi TaxID=1982044 RepID=A0A2G1QSA5_9HYPH|nr:aminopeptidase N [Zhengella mangrovi]PHP68334.1 aminopeptidase N [Zhengella mangrovi]
MRTDTGQVFKLSDYQPTDYLIASTHMTFRLEEGKATCKAVLSVERRDGVAEGAPLVLDGDGLDLASLKLDGKLLNEGYEATPDRLTLANPPARFDLEIVTRLDPDANKALSGLYRSSGNYCTQCEAEGFRRITYFLDRPDVLSVYSVRIEAPKDGHPVMLSNGNPGETGDLREGWHFAEWHDPHPKPSYLFALVAGDLARVSDRFTTMEGRPVDLGIYVEHGKEDRAAYAMDALKRSMRWDEEVFGRAYDLDVFNIVAVSDFNMGAMENKGLNVFNDKYVLADEATATDADFANIEAIIAHEYFHNWTGNRITCRDWFQLCLKEGLTVFRDHEFSADMRSRGVKRIAEVRLLKSHQFPEDAGPLAHPVRPRAYREINNFYTATVYEKGSEVVRMIRTVLGAETFRAGMDLYFERHDGDAATIEDFLACFEDASGRNLSQFALWYHQAGTPHLSIKASHDARTGQFVLDVEQSVPATPGESRKKLMHIPLAFGLVGPDGEDMAPTGIEGAEVRDGVIHLTKRKHTIRFSGIHERPVPSLLRGFSAPVTLAFEQSEADRMFLARHDNDAFSRWQALDRLFSDELIRLTRLARGGKAMAVDRQLVALAGEIAADGALEPAYRSLALTLPGEADIAREIGEDVDPDAIFAARNVLSTAIADGNGDGFRQLYDGLEETGRFRPDAAQAGRRALRLTLLGYLTGEAETALAKAHFDTAGNMTDLAGALAVLTQKAGGSAAAEAALEAFEARFRDDPLVLDKWFSMQAMMPGDAALARVKGLMDHPGFQIANPNRVRSLIGIWASANQTGFHRPDGEGYAFFAETVLAIGKMNPQVAARLATALRSWRSLEPKRREKARKALVSMANAPDLSTDLKDIVDRTLA